MSTTHVPGSRKSGRGRRTHCRPARPPAGETTRDDVSDEELVARVHAGDDRCLDTLLLRYQGFARAKARAYFLVGADHDDIVQEGMIGLYKAIRDFDAQQEMSFRAFAGLCVDRQVLTAVRTATRRKHGPLNSYVSFDRPMLLDEEGERTLADVLPTSPLTDPAEQVVSAERVRDLQRSFVAVLSDLEVEVLRLHVDGRSYREIAGMLQRHTKSIDNTLQRIKRKLDSLLMDRDAEIA